MFLIAACNPEEEKISKSGDLDLIFNADTVLFDTLLTDVLSFTKRFRISNPNKKAVNISNIRLAGGPNSPYSIIVNGKSGPLVEDELIFGGDSLLILVSVEVSPLDLNMPYLVKDSVVVDWNGNSHDVKLVAWGQDANYLKDQVICDQTWSSDRPYVIQGLVLVDTLCTLTVEPGARIYMDNRASFFVKGTLKIMGDSANRVTIRNTRFDDNYLEAPGQWGALYFLEGSNQNEIHYADIENGTIGLRIGSPDDNDEYDLIVSHTSIRHMSGAGILAFTSDFYAYNMEIYNTANFLVGNFAGGNYRYEHCTFVNTPSSFIIEDPVLQFSDNFKLPNDELLVDKLSVRLANCIIWGPGKEELYINGDGGTEIGLELGGNIIKSEQSIPGNFTSTENDFPGFVSAVGFDYQLDSLAFARDKGIDLGVGTDITGTPRDTKPDIGAYERIDP